MYSEHSGDRCVRLAVAAALFGLASTASAEFAAGVKAGTLGLGLELTTDLTETLNLRAGVNRFSYGYDSVESDIEYRLDLDLQSVSLLADWHLFRGAFRITGGVMRNDNELTGRSLPTDGSYEIDGQRYDAGQVGTLLMGADFDSSAPYLGIGWGNAVDTDGRWHFTSDLGVLMQGSPVVRLEADGPLRDNEDFRQALRNEEASLQEDVEDYEYYPVLSVGISYRF